MNISYEVRQITPRVKNHRGYDDMIFDLTVFIDFIDTDTNSSIGYQIFHNFDTEIELQVQEKIQFPTSTENKGAFTIVQNAVNPFQSANALATALGFTGSTYYAYQVNEEVVYEYLTDVKLVCIEHNGKILNEVIRYCEKFEMKVISTNLENVILGK